MNYRLIRSWIYRGNLVDSVLSSWVTYQTCLQCKNHIINQSLKTAPWCYFTNYAIFTDEILENFLKSIKIVFLIRYGPIQPVLSNLSMLFLRRASVNESTLKNAFESCLHLKSLKEAWPCQRTFSQFSKLFWGAGNSVPEQIDSRVRFFNFWLREERILRFNGRSVARRGHASQTVRQAQQDGSRLT